MRVMHDEVAFARRVRTSSRFFVLYVRLLAFSLHLLTRSPVSALASHWGLQGQPRFGLAQKVLEVVLANPRPPRMPQQPDPSSTRSRWPIRNPSPSLASAASLGARVETASSAAACPPRRERSSFGIVVHRSRRSTTRRRGTPAVGLRFVGQLGDAAFPSVLACFSPRSRFAWPEEQVRRESTSGPVQRSVSCSSPPPSGAAAFELVFGRTVASIRSRAALESCARLCLPP